MERPGRGRGCQWGDCSLLEAALLASAQILLPGSPGTVLGLCSHRWCGLGRGCSGRNPAQGGRAVRHPTPPLLRAPWGGHSPHVLPLFQGRQILPGAAGCPLADGAGAAQAPVPGASPDRPPRQQHPQQQRRPPAPPGGLGAAETPAGTFHLITRWCSPAPEVPWHPDRGRRKPPGPGWDYSVPTVPPSPSHGTVSLLPPPEGVWAASKRLRLPHDPRSSEGCRWKAMPWGSLGIWAGLAGS